MSRPNLADRFRSLLTTASDALAPTGVRIAVTFGGVGAAIALHAVTDQNVWAFASVAPILLAGLAGSLRFAVSVAAVAAIGHSVVDAWQGVALFDLAAFTLRALVLLGIGLLGAIGTQLERQREQALKRSVTEEPITGLLNVRAFYDELERLRAADTPFAILLADIRGMRALNERYGHPTGTEAMRALAHVLRRSAGADVLASRLGSDEVAIALVGADRDRCRSVVDKIVARLHDEQVSLPDGERFEVHAAYGIARFPEDGADEVSVLRAADRAKERAKAAGLDRVGTASGDLL